MCIFAALGLLVPRITLAVLWLLGRTDGTYDPWWLGLVGFFVLPYTTLAWALIAMRSGSVELTAGPLIILAIALLIDTGAWSSTRRSKK